MLLTQHLTALRVKPPTEERSRQNHKTMPFLKANDGIILHYNTHGSNNAPPLILVSAAALCRPHHTQR